MKTIEQWFNTLPWGIRELALENTSEHKKRWFEPSLYGALDIAFLWHATEEGGDFWIAVYRECLHEEHERDKKRERRCGL